MPGIVDASPAVRNDPYWGWFNTFSGLLHGLDASFYADRGSTALLVWGRAARTPFGSVSYAHKVEIGRAIAAVIGAR